MGMKEKPLSSKEEQIRKLVEDFEDLRLSGKEVAIDEFIKQVPEGSGVDKKVLREYLSASEVLLEQGKTEAAKVSPLTDADQAKIKSSLKAQYDKACQEESESVGGTLVDAVALEGATSFLTKSTVPPAIAAQLREPTQANKKGLIGFTQPKMNTELQPTQTKKSSGRKKQSLKQIDEKIAQNDKRRRDLGLQKACGLARTGKNEEAVAEFQKACGIEQGKPEKSVLLKRQIKRQSQQLKEYQIQLKDALFDKAEILYDSDGPEEVIEDVLSIYDDILRIDPKNVSAWTNKGVVLERLNRYDEALITHETVIKINPKDATVWINKGVALWKLSRYDEALAAYETAIRINPKAATAWSNKGVVLERLNRYDEALAAFETAIRINPKAATAWSNKGVVLVKLNRYDEALAAHETAIKINPKAATAWFNKSCCYSLKGERDNALASLKKSTDFDAKYKELAKTDEDFKNLWNDEEFKRIIQSPISPEVLKILAHKLRATNS